MKAEILKIAKVKNEKDFYAKYPTEEAFMKAHKKAFKKAEMGMQMDKSIPKAQWGDIKPLGQIDPNANMFNVTAPKLNWSNETPMAPAPGKFSVEGQANQFSAGLKSPDGGPLSKIGGPMGALNIGQNIVGSIQQIKQEKEQRRQAKQEFKVSEVVKEASELKPQAVNRKYVRPEDQVFDPNQMSPTYGVGTNYLKYGGEIQNTYAPNTLYDDLGYEPLSESDIKKYQFGGAAGNIGQMAGSWIGGGKGAASGAGQLGSTIGGTAGKLFGPVGEAVGGFLGGAIGGVIGGKGAAKTAAYQEGTDQNNQATALNQSVKNLQFQNSAFMRHGGNISMNEGLDGDLRTHWGGGLEPISENPYLPDGGETVMFRGNSHEEGDGNGRTGIGATYGGTPIEAERGEPAMKMQDGGGQDNMIVFGNLQIPSFGANIIGDENAKGKKFKNYVKDLSEQEAKQNKVADKGVKLVDEADPRDKFDRLKMASGEALMKGSDMKMKNIAQKKQLASVIQNAILETADEYGLESDSLAKGKIKQAKKGASIPKYQDSGDPVEKSIEEGIKKRSISGQGFIETIEQLEKDGYSRHGDTRSLYTKMTPGTPGQKYIPNENDWWKSLTPEQKAAHNAQKREQIKNDPKYAGTPGQEDLVNIEPQFGFKEFDFSVPKPDGKALVQKYMEKLGKQGTPAQVNDKGKAPKEEREGLDWMDAINAALPFMRPSNQLDRPDINPEMFALASNQLDPVQAQLYNPLLEQTSDISLQDQMNANQADFNAMQRMISNNPAALAQLAGQKYQANTGVLGEQFRQNQAEKRGVFNRNRGTLNDAQLKNLGILDNQFVRQATAKSKTKETALAALSSISDKIAKNKMENRTLDVYENLYNYRFGPQGRAWNLNPLAQYNMSEVGENYQELDKDGRVIETESVSQRRNRFNFPQGNTHTKRVTKVKKNKNGSIVKALKNF